MDPYWGTSDVTFGWPAVGGVVLIRTTPLIKGRLSVPTVPLGFSTVSHMSASVFEILSLQSTPQPKVTAPRALGSDNLCRVTDRASWALLIEGTGRVRPKLRQ